jgi:hypothetical protein
MSDTIYPYEETRDLQTIADLQSNKETDPEYWAPEMSRRIIDLTFRVTKLEAMFALGLERWLDKYEASQKQRIEAVESYVRKNLDELYNKSKGDNTI